MKNTILPLIILLALFSGISCKKSSNTTSTNKTTPPAPTSTQTVNIQIQWSYGHSVAENQMSYTKNGCAPIVLTPTTAITYQTSANLTIGQVSLTANVGDVFTMSGPALYSGVDKLAFDQTNPVSTQMVDNGTVTGTVQNNGHDMEHTSASGVNTFSFTAH